MTSEGCRIAVRKWDGPVALEIFLLAEPAKAGATASAQAEAVFSGIDAVLREAGASWSAVTRETIFLASCADDLAAVRSVRAKFAASSVATTLEIEQPPLDEGARLLVGVHATVSSAPPEAGLRLDHATVAGEGEGALAQTRSAFERAEGLLAEAGLDFPDVVRTWLHLRDIDADYDALNEGRRAFFESRGIDPPPASTGIGGGPADPSRALCLGFEARRRSGAAAPVVMHAATLNEAPEYGADFVRGLRVPDRNATTIHVSGTASVDEAGRTAHPGDFDAQAERMLLNVQTLLEGQGAGFGDIVYAITYLKNRADADRLRAALAAAGFEGFPHALVEAPVCRPDLLCETEAIALLPAD